MNKKHIKSLCYFLTLIFLMLSVSAVCAADADQSTDVDTISEQTTQPVVTTEKTNDFTNNNNFVNNEKTVKNINKVKDTTTEKTADEETRLKTNLTVESANTVYVGDTISIYGKLSQNGTNLAKQQISVRINDEQYNVTTNKNGNYSLKYTPKSAGIKGVLANFNGTDIYAPDNALTLFLANQKISNLTIGSTKTVKYGDPISIYGKLSYNGTNLANQNISIFVNTDQYNVTTTQYGNYNLKITPETAGIKAIVANYAGTDVYSMAIATSVSNVVQNNTKVTVGSRTNVTVGDEMSIYGKLTDNNGNNLANQKVSVLVDGKQYNVTTTKYGNYNFKITPETAGIKAILATYAGEGIYTPSAAISSFIVTKKISNLTVGSAKNITLGNPISIYGKLSQNGKNLAYENITVLVDGETYNITTNQYGNYKFQITPETAGIKAIISTYKGSDEYTIDVAASSFTVNRITSNLTVGSRKSVNIDEPMSIYGKLSQNGKDIANQKIIVTVDGKIHIVTTTQYGNYKFQITPTTTGPKTINAYYAGSTEFTTATATETFVVNKKTTNITVGSRANVNVGEQMSIYGKLTDANGKNLENQTVTVTVDGETYNVTTTAYGNYNFKIVPQTAGVKTITATYEGSNIYTPATATSTFFANQQTSNITVGSRANVNVGELMSVYGKLSANGNNVPYEKISVKVDGKDYEVTTNQYGNYNFKIIPTTAGTQTIIANFAGTNVYTSSIATSKFTAN